MNPEKYTIEELVEALHDYADRDCFSEEQFKTRRMCWELATRIEKHHTKGGFEDDSKKVL